jgi:hypothetical protein
MTKLCYDIYCIFIIHVFSLKDKIFFLNINKTKVNYKFKVRLIQRSNEIILPLKSSIPYKPLPTTIDGCLLIQNLFHLIKLASLYTEQSC